MTLKGFLHRKVLCLNMAKRGDSPPPFGVHFRSDGSVSASAGFDANDISPYTLQIMQAMGSLGIFARGSESPDLFVGGSDKKKVEDNKIEIAKEKDEKNKADASSASTSLEKSSEKKSKTGGGGKKPKAKAQKKSNKKK